MPEQLFFRSGDISEAGRVYTLVSREEISLRDVITFPRDAAAVLGEPFSWAEFEAVAEEIEALPDEERGKHPMGDFFTAVSVWASRRAAGDQITFGQCLDADFKWVESAVKRPQDRQPGKRNGAKKAPAKKRKPTRTSAPVVERPPSEPTG